MAIIIDRREGGTSKNFSDRERYKKRKEQQIRDALKDKLKSGSIEDFVNGKPVRVPVNDEIDGVYVDRQNWNRVFVGNPKYHVGDTIPKPPGGDGSGQQGEDGEDDFKFLLTPEEVEKYIYQDLELPFLDPKLGHDISEVVTEHAGFTKTGLPSNLSIIRSFRNSIGRNLSMAAGFDEEIEKLKLLEQTQEVLNQIKELEELKVAIPFIDDIDLRYRTFEDKPIPITAGVIFFMMDVSGSMDEQRKKIGKIFLLLLYLFVRRFYDKIDLVLIRHTTEAKICKNEDEFFRSKDNGGTSFMSGYTLIDKLITEKYDPAKYNIYIAQASDGENFPHEDKECHHMLVDKFLPIVSLFVFIGCYMRDNNIADYVKEVVKISRKTKKVQITNIADEDDCLKQFIKMFKRDQS